MPITYTALKSKIAAYAENDGTEFDAEIDGMIDKAEAKISRDLDIPGYSRHQNAQLTPGDPFLTRPPTAITVRHFTVQDANGDHQPVEKRTIEYLRTFWPNRSDRGLPRFYAEWDDLCLLLAPTPDSTYPVEVSHRERVEALTTTQTTSILSNEYEDLLFIGCMIYAEAFDKNFANNGPQTWLALYEDALASARTDAARYHSDEFQTGPMVG